MSRHKSPDKYYKFKFNNGREIVVTPEHPMYIHRDGELKTIRADLCKLQDFIPIPELLPNSSKPVELKINNKLPDVRAKIIEFPKYITTELSRILGYFVTEGHSYKGSTAEFGFSNMDVRMLQEFEDLMDKTFGISPSYNNREDGLVTLRFLSIELFTWFENNFPEIMHKARQKRIPKLIMGGSVDNARNLLITAFQGDGSVESSSICYRTSSLGLSHDYKDLLLKLSCQVRIVEDTHDTSYKVYIKGESLLEFFDLIVKQNDARYEKIEKLMNKSKSINRQHDVYPTSIAQTVISLKSKISIPYDGYYHRHLKENHGITKTVLKKDLDIITEKFDKIQIYLEENTELSMQEFCSLFKYSQSKIAEISDLLRSTINYYLTGGYNKEKREEINNIFNSKIREYFIKLNSEIENLKSFTQSKLRWNRISNIEIIENKGENYKPWVYDITVEPNHTFISQGVVLHNTVSITKAGIIATLLARTSIIAAANPKYGRYTEHKTPAQNINLSAPLLSRFDLIFIVKDIPNEEHDKNIADFILGMHSGDAKKKYDLSHLIPISLLKKYIKYAKNKIKPKLMPEAVEIIKEFYLDLRNQNQNMADEDTAIAVVARNLEGYIRLTEAYAKMALKSFVSKEDAENALKLARRSLEDTSRDPVTGKFDADIILSGVSSAKKKLNMLLDELKKKIDDNNSLPISEEDFIDDMEVDLGMDRNKVEEMIKMLNNEGAIYKPPGGKLQMSKKNKR